jgi:hypothetical protein
MMIPRESQNESHPGFVGKALPYDCFKCMNHHARQYHYDELSDEEGLEAWTMYLTLQDQQRIGMDVLGLDYTCLEPAFRLLGLPREKWRAMFQRIIIINRAVQERNARKRDQQRLANLAKQQHGGMSGAGAFNGGGGGF